ncbi:hypothetical protein K2173_027054 [Erythroxylum novogranatense]|uniref:DUF4218 domain-containing protein n=1 Tax=Erythroxylum novogranatense TaxID=1862640 RepID=A0AAV8TXX7_9ROSI|nr:hypothetical protein K2173_027054 [Erythroxylum novogranatense]
MRFGMDQSYTRWVLQGEKPEYRFMSRVERLDSANIDIDGMGNDINEGDGDEEDDGMQDLLHDMGTFVNDCPIDEDGRTRPKGVEDFIGQGFHELLSKATEELYPGCTNFSKLSFLIKLLHLKVYKKWSNNSFDMLLGLLKDVLPNCETFPKSYYETNQFLRSLGLGYVSIHACKYDCSLFWKEYGDLQSCPMCGTSRWRINDGKGKKIPWKVLRYFPLKSRLQRLFMSSKTAKQMTWHNDRTKGDGNTMVHPSDGEAWKSFDELYPDFAREPRNVRLGLATDGFNPHGNMSLSYSVWPVVLLAYNLPPWMCMDESFFMLSLVIPGPKAVGRDIDVYMRPLVDELSELWEDGFDVFDASKGEKFRMHAALLWTINDFPAYGTISGWSTKGYKACPVCNTHTPSCKLRSKIGYLGHRRFLPYNHPWRRSKKFDGKSDHRTIPNLPDGDAVVEQLCHVENICYGKHPSNKRTLNWNKKSILFDLPYWHKLRLRHNLDVMHIEKNICDNILGTLMNVEGKTKDTIKDRLDLEDMNIWKELHLIRAADGTFVGKPPACYTMSLDEKKKFCEFVKQVKFPDGYASNISRCVNVEERKISGLKSHDCHILLQSILPLGTRGILNKDVTGVLLKLGNFFRRICRLSLNKDDVQTMCEEIILILCKLEMIYPPAFFDVMVHLAIHLPNEALLGGPVAYRWMYPIERFLGTLKGFVRNKARPEGSIAEAYVVKECTTFCSMYLKGIETNFNNRFNDMVDGSDISVFCQQCKPIGSGKIIALPTKELEIAHWYVFMNCHEIRSFTE